MIRWMARTSYNGVRRNLPTIIRLVWEVIVSMAKLVFLAQVNYWVNVPSTSRTIANQWVGKAIMIGIPPQFDRVIFWIARFVAVQLLLVGFILNAYLIVWIISLF